MGRARVLSSLVIRSVKRSETVYEDSGQGVIESLYQSSQSEGDADG
jgi:hypothetical protein